MSAALAAFAWGFVGGVAAVVALAVAIVVFAIAVIRPAPATEYDYEGDPQ